MIFLCKQTYLWFSLIDKSNASRRFMHNSHFLFVGTAKAGTTSIYKYLNQHPEVSIPVKETFYFIRELYEDLSLGYPKQRSREDLILQPEKYADLYPHNSSKIYGEVGTGYLYHYNQSIPSIIDTLGRKTKILIILRNPVDRAYSSYMHFVKDVHEILSFEESIDIEKERKSLGYDFMWMHVDMGLYYAQVKAYLEAFDEVKVLITEEFKQDPEKEMKGIFSFLNVDSNFQLNFNKEHNKSGRPKLKRLQRFMTHENVVKKALRPAFRALYTKQKREQIRKKVKNMNIGSYPPMKKQTEEFLRDIYREDVKKLEALLDRKIKCWGF